MKQGALLVNVARALSVDKELTTCQPFSGLWSPAFVTTNIQLIHEVKTAPAINAVFDNSASFM